MTERCLFDLEAVCSMIYGFWGSVEMGNLTSADPRSSCSHWRFRASRAQQTCSGARGAFEIFLVFHVGVSGPRAGPRRRTLSSEASVQASPPPRLIEPNVLIIFPQRAVSPTTPDAMLNLQLQPIRALNSHSGCSDGGQQLITSWDSIIALRSCQAAQVSRRAD